MADPATDKIRLCAFGTGWGVPFATAAPFPLKLATWLRMAVIPFDFVVANDAGKGPKGKSPWIEYGSVRMGDASSACSKNTTTSASSMSYSSAGGARGGCGS